MQTPGLADFLIRSVIPSFPVSLLGSSSAFGWFWILA
jgi:hypothetical protein